MSKVSFLRLRSPVPLPEVSIVEIYNDKVRDLLVPCSRRPSTHGGQNLKVHEDPLRGIYVGDCTEIYVRLRERAFRTYALQRTLHVGVSCMALRGHFRGAKVYCQVIAMIIVHV